MARESSSKSQVEAPGFEGKPTDDNKAKKSTQGDKEKTSNNPISLKKIGLRRNRVGGPEQRMSRDRKVEYHPPIFQNLEGGESASRKHNDANKYSSMGNNDSKRQNGQSNGHNQISGSSKTFETPDASEAGFSGKKSKRYISREIATMSTVDSEGLLSQDSEFVVVKQRIAYLCIVVSALQLALLLTQLILCGVASVEINPMIGPFPDAFSEWGGKNAYLMLEDKQYFRIITPVFLHVGVLHLLVNAFCQLETCAFFEREWGSGRWLILYIISGIGCVGTSSVVNPDLIGVCSSGALMGLFGAKIAHVITWTAFDLHDNTYYDTVHLDQLSGVMCSTAIVSILSFFTYIDWSGHMGGFVAGFLGGMFIFSRPIASTCIRVLWGSIGLFGLLGGSSLIGYLLITETFPDEDLSDACSYFRNLYPEGYDCECAWD
jgi:membrane associated rhomboid family serine protease